GTLGGAEPEYQSRVAVSEGMSPVAMTNLIDVRSQERADTARGMFRHRPSHFLNLRPEPHQQGSFRLTSSETVIGSASEIATALSASCPSPRLRCRSASRPSCVLSCLRR